MVPAVVVDGQDLERYGADLRPHGSHEALQPFGTVVGAESEGQHGLRLVRWKNGLPGSVFVSSGWSHSMASLSIERDAVV